MQFVPFTPSQKPGPDLAIGILEVLWLYPSVYLVLDPGSGQETLF